ncbi:aldo/keto reductase [Pelagibacterium montanilacus]|uniref:aldo/keto reductase n=1 Tax=Pelagibacterium montanilacus TaxID=2185280 RepID=UPI000F8E9576|nr:aldo/keto reductase [Pelagibacterium montanilacus]
MASTPLITLNDGVTIPQLGFGVWQIPDEEVAEKVRVALEAGYRHIDTAKAYRNESGVGEALRSSGLARDDIFVTTKLWNTDQGYDSTLAAFDGSMERLGLDVLDLYLIHWPQPMFDDYLDTWKAMVKLKEDGRIRSIGVSNFLPEHLDKIIGETGVVPSVNQIEVHPRFQQRELRAFCAEKGIAVEGWSPLGRGNMLEDPSITAIASAHGKTAAQVVIRWHLQHGNILFPKSVTPSRIRENFEVFDFELSADQIAALDAMDDPEGRTGPNPATFDLR